ncbi:transcriptional regulator [Arachidicoccus ginsenosidimutans]|uniref:GntR family transcriptional regulator n=1 Tax=Arachidicoccus sp. BS20 TaxID=1850526 RepID=UPI0007F0CE58|nr:winged helix-turn-helix domain-containing protein [Arachidicoccus sp. BS20]ANI89653.1 transcriptional regulator [Arachidicoccus sp. BS20]
MDYFFKHIEIDEYSVTPKYLQLANSIIKAITDGKLQDSDQLPSLNNFSTQFEISRDTVVKSFNYLKNIGILGTVPGKGFFIRNADSLQFHKVFLLFNKLSAHKKIIYDSFVASLGASAIIDFYIYNNDFHLFKNLIEKSIDNYTHYVIIPHLTQEESAFAKVLQLIPPGKLILLDKAIPSLSDKCSMVFEDFKNDIYNALDSISERLQKYHTLKIIFPDYAYHPKEILEGFNDFCIEHCFNHGIIENIKNEIVRDGTVYISLMEDDLVVLLEKIMENEKGIGKDVGVISYNETPIKKILLNGITTISTDFKMMGQSAAQIIMDKTVIQSAIPFSCKLRNSL